MKTYVIDTNVLNVANGKAEQAGPACVLACLKKLADVKSSGRVAVDIEAHIFREYKRNASMSGQPGAGDAFFKWLHDRQGMVKHCELVRTNPRNNDGTEYEFFEDREGFDGFDPSDKKFLVVALKSDHGPIILNAVDSDWRAFKDPMSEVGVLVQELCS